MTLAHQLRDLPGFRWAPGMRVRNVFNGAEYVLLRTDGSGWWWAAKANASEIVSGLLDNCVLDLADDATGGILFASLRDAVAIMRTVDGRYQATLAGSLCYGNTLGEACAALMVARGRCGC